MEEVDAASNTESTSSPFVDAVDDGGERAGREPLAPYKSSSSGERNVDVDAEGAGCATAGIAAAAEIFAAILSQFFLSNSISARRPWFSDCSQE